MVDRQSSFSFYRVYNPFIDAGSCRTRPVDRIYFGRRCSFSLALCAGSLCSLDYSGVTVCMVKSPFLSHHRTRSALYRRLFSRRKIIFWDFITLFLVFSLVLLILYGEFQALIYIVSGLTLLALQFQAWWRLHLEDLAASEPEQDSWVDINQQAQPDLLPHAVRAKNPQDLWKRVRTEWEAQFIFNRLLILPDQFDEAIPQDPDKMDEMWVEAERLSKQLGLQGISIGAVVVVLLLSVPNIEQWLRSHQLSTEALMATLRWQQRTSNIMRNLRTKPLFGGIARDWSAGYTPVLNRFGHDLSGDIQHGAFRHLYLQTHSSLIDQMLTQLSQAGSSGVALIGKNGSGKTSIVYSLAERLLNGDSDSLRYHKVFSIDATAVVSEANRSGNLESLMVQIVMEAKKAGNVILFFDDAQSFFAQESGASDMTNIILQILQSKAVKSIFALQPSDWQHLTSVAPDITASLEAAHIEEPDQETVERVMQDQSLAIEGSTGCFISYRAIKEAYRLSSRYTLEQSFPGKGIALLKSATSHAEDGLVSEDSVRAAVESMTGTKVATANPKEQDILLNLEDKLHERMINQNSAVSAVANALRRARAGVRDQNRPIGSFLFLGPTGVGKTELSKALAATYFGGEDRIIRLDMSEYNQPQSTERLLAPAANPGTFLTQVRMQPFSVVLLDEIEKASSEVLNLLLQMLDEGSLTDIDGMNISFKDAIVITTSNAGADIIRSNIEAGQNLEDFASDFTDKLINEQYFKPELINRFDEVVLFRPLNKSELMDVLSLLISGINHNLSDKQIKISLSNDAAQYLVEEGYDPRLGARPMRRVVQRTVENVIARRMLEGGLKPGDEAVLDVDDLKLSS